MYFPCVQSILNPNFFGVVVENRGFFLLLKQECKIESSEHAGPIT